MSRYGLIAFFYANISPIFYVETLADLKKKFNDGRTPEEEVRRIADKFPDQNGYPCAFHLNLARKNLLGTPIPMVRQIPVIKGKPVKVNEKSGITFEPSSEADAFIRWGKQEFLEIERRFASVWREQLANLNFDKIKEVLASLAVDIKSCKSLEQAKQIANALVSSQEKKHAVMNLACMLLRIRPEHKSYIFEYWKNKGYKSLSEYAPYTAHVVSIEIFFHIVFSSGLIVQQPSSYMDIAYLHYLPFCMVFVSSDKLHRRCAPLFMKENQQFIWGEDLKNDLKRLNQHYDQLLDMIKEEGISYFAKKPPKEERFLVAEIWDKQFPSWREEKVEVYRTKADDLKIIEEANKFKEAPKLAAHEIDFDVTDPDALFLQRHTRIKKKGSWYLLPKRLQTDGDETQLNPLTITERFVVKEDEDLEKK